MASSSSSYCANAPHFAVFNNRFQRIPSGTAREEIESEERAKEEEQKAHQKQVISDNLKERKIFSKEEDIRTFLDLKTFEAASRFFAETMITTSQTAHMKLDEFLKMNQEYFRDDYEIDSIAQTHLVEILTENNSAVRRLASGAEGRIFESAAPPVEGSPKSVHKALKSKDYTAESTEVRIAREIKSGVILPVSCVTTTDPSYELGPSFEVGHALCMERGTSVESIFSDETKSLGEKLTILLQVAETVSVLHNQNQLSHHDLKPDNIILRENGRLSLIDPSKVCQFGELKKQNVGTMIYSSPPDLFQAGGYRVDHAVDMWSMGMMLYKVITDKLPFMGMAEFAIAFAIMSGEYKDKIFCDDIEKKWKEIIASLESVAGNMYILDDSEEPVTEKGPAYFDLPVDELIKATEESVKDIFSNVLDELIVIERLRSNPHLVDVESEEFKKTKEEIIEVLDKSFDQITIKDLEVFHNFLNLKLSCVSGNYDPQYESILLNINMIIREMKLRQYPELRALCVKLLDDNPAKRGTSNDLILALDKFLVDHPELLEV